MNKKCLSLKRVKDIISNLLRVGVKYVEVDLTREVILDLVGMVERYKLSSYDALYLLLAKEKNVNWGNVQK